MLLERDALVSAPQRSSIQAVVRPRPAACFGICSGGMVPNAWRYFGNRASFSAVMGDT